ncbi:MAG: hypothetical protein JXA25_09470 [Anaerolineales bacterium]|nr:hypothetical protein [Anaerolineales bacterium]
MEKRGVLSKTLAVVRAALIWFPVLAPILLTVFYFFTHHVFRFDYLMPAELFPFALVGGGLLVWAALRVRSFVKLIGWGIGTATAMLFGGQGLAVVTGLASGETEPSGVWWILVLTVINLYSVALIVTGIGAYLLLRDLLGRKES